MSKKERPRRDHGCARLSAIRGPDLIALQPLTPTDTLPIFERMYAVFAPIVLLAALAKRRQRHTQYFEMFGNRALYHDGWIA